jgi:thiol-disulfide isomerase/thioredoxin
MVREFGLLLVSAQSLDGNSSASLSHLLEHLGTSRPQSGASELIIIANPRDPSSNKYKTTVEDLTQESVARFVARFSEGLLQPYFRSEPEESLATRPFEAVPVVGSSLRKFLSIPGKDKAVLFYAPWCSLCVRAVESVDRTARDSTESRVLIAKMDMSRTDAVGETVTRFPTLAYFGIKGSRIDYSGEFVVEDIQTWIAEQRSAARDDL